MYDRIVAAALLLSLEKRGIETDSMALFCSFIRYRSRRIWRNDKSL